MKEDNV